MSRSEAQLFSDGHVEQRLLAATREGKIPSAGPEADQLSGVDGLDGITANLAAVHVDKHFPPDTRLITYHLRAHTDVEVWKLKQRSA